MIHDRVSQQIQARTSAQEAATDEFLSSGQLVLRDDTLCETFDLLFDRVLLLRACVFACLTRLGVVVPEPERLTARQA